MVYKLDARHRAVTIDNLDKAFGASKTAEDKCSIGRNTYRHFGAMLFEILSLGPSEKYINSIVDVEGVEHYEVARARGKGVLLVAAHFGNWEIHAIAHGYQLGPIAVVARPQENPHYNRWLERIRTFSQNTVLYRERALQRMLQLLKEGETVAALVDQNVEKEAGVFVDFFGRKAATTPVLSWLAVKTGAALVPVFTLPLPDGRYRLIYEQPIDERLYMASNRKYAIQQLTQECASVLEAYVRRNPEYWLWMHRRWRTRPVEEQQQSLGLASEGVN